MKKGKLSINSENIFPIIKKWLYSDMDIFVRELISNASDAITKLKKLNTMGEWQEPEGEKYRIDVTENKEVGTISFSDNGIGMTEEEVGKYINEIAFSGAGDFLEKYKDKSDKDQIIGHFGLGFYSAFMVADQVEIDTLSYIDGAKPVKWISDGEAEYRIEESTRTTRGTTITLKLSEEGREFTGFKLKEIIKKYCSFMPVEIFIDEDEKPVNTIQPLYTKNPSEVTDEEYRQFYKETFMDFKEPLFWIHLNMDYPFNLKGIMYFPKISLGTDIAEGRVKLYNSQVFVADNIKEVIPEFLLLLKGVVDCPDLPLNVSRSFLQNDGFVRRISSYITKKVADKLSGIFNTSREEYEAAWEDIGPFIKYGILRDEKFADQIKEKLIFKTPDGSYISLQDLGNEKIYYSTNQNAQSQLIDAVIAEGRKCIILDHPIDSALINYLESSAMAAMGATDTADATGATAPTGESKPGEGEDGSQPERLEFARVDSGVDSEKTQIDETVKSLFSVPAEIVDLKDADIASMMVTDEQGRRMKDMIKQFGMTGMPDLGEDKKTLQLNKNNKLVAKFLSETDEEKKKLYSRYLYLSAELVGGDMTPDSIKELTKLMNDVLTS